MHDLFKISSHRVVKNWLVIPSAVTLIFIVCFSVMLFKLIVTVHDENAQN